MRGSSYRFFAITRPRVGRVSRRRLERPGDAGDGERRDEGVTDGRIVGACSEDRSESAHGEAIEPREPRAVRDAHAGQWHAGGAELGADDTRACGRRSSTRDRRAQLLEHHLGGEVVALPVEPTHIDSGSEVEDRERIGRCRP